MNKAFYIVNLVLSVVFMATCIYYVDEVSSAQLEALFSSFNTSDPYAYLYSSYDAGSDLTAEAALISIFFFLMFITTDLLGIIKMKTKTVKVLGIIGLSLSGILLLWDLLMMSSPGSISFDEVGAVFVLYSFVVMAFSIVGLIQSIRYEKQGKAAVVANNSDLLDS